MVLRRALPAVVLALSPRSLQAWGPGGHAIVARIAEMFISPKANATLHDLLEGESMSAASDWCDNYDHSPGGEWSAPLHYINYPGQACAFNWAQDCKDDLCNAGALVNYTMRAHNTSASKDDLHFALRFVIHMIGDIHQPLHVASSGDKGGNSITVHPHFSAGLGGHPGHGGGVKLHKVWDDTILQQATLELGGSGGKNDWQLLAARLVQRIKGDWSGNVTAWQQPVAAHMNDASLRSGLTVVAGDTATLGCADAYAAMDGSRVKDGDSLGRDYFLRAEPVVEVQLAKAGVRLAQILSDIFPATESVVLV